VVIWRSSHIEKHLGFLARFSGAELADRAVVQTKRFGANVPVEAVRLDLGDGVQAVHVGGARSPVCWRPWPYACSATISPGPDASLGSPQPF
jgi:hypothetical protein